MAIKRAALLFGIAGALAIIMAVYYRPLHRYEVLHLKSLVDYVRTIF